MNTQTAINCYEDIIDSRDVIARIEYLMDEFMEATGDDPREFSMSEDDYLAGLSTDEAHELQALIDLQDEAKHYAPDWYYGEALIRGSYFAEYAEQLAEDIGAISPDYQWPLSHIDWDAAAEALKQDYTCADFDGIDYWIRG